MLAEIHAAEPLPLLFEPDPPGVNGRAYHGWVRAPFHIWRPSEPYRRRHEDDEYGARVQHAIVAYAFRVRTRAELSRDLGVCETQIQHYVRGNVWGAYGRPVLRALERLGIGRGRGNWQRQAVRPREIIAACQAVMLRCLETFDTATPSPDERERVLADLRLLTAALVTAP